MRSRNLHFIAFRFMLIGLLVTGLSACQGYAPVDPNDPTNNDPVAATVVAPEPEYVAVEGGYQQFTPESYSGDN